MLKSILQQTGPTGPAQDNSHTSAPVLGQDGRQLELLLAELLSTQEAKKILAILSQNLFSTWGKEKGFRKKLANTIGERISSGFLDDLDRTKSLKDEQYLLETISKFSVYLAPFMEELLITALTQLEQLPPEKQTQVLSRMISGLSTGKSGKLITILLKTINQIHKHDPLFFSRTILPGCRTWLTELDFGELKEGITGSRADLQNMFQGILDVLWQYPSKLLLILSFLPDLLNLLLEITGPFLKTINQLSPDLTADIFLSLFKSLDARSLGKVIDQGSELIRKIHTGSSLLGDPGQPQLASDLSRFISTLLAEIDPAILHKAHIALREDQETISRSITNTMTGHQAFWKQYFQNIGRIKNPRLRSRQQFWYTLEENLDTGLDEAILKGLQDMEWQEIAETINSILTISNRVMADHSALFVQIAQTIYSTLDLDELSQFMKQAIIQARPEIIPVARAILPEVIITLCSIMDKREDEYEEEMALARKKMKKLVCSL